MHALLIGIHAAAATLALIAAVAGFRFPRLASLHAGATLVMAGALGGALWVGRTTTAMPLELVFLALLGLAAYMSYRSLQAWHTRPRPGQRPGVAYLAALGFNTIGLTTGLLAIGALRLGWGVPAVVIASVAPTLIGRLPLNGILRRARQQSPTPDLAPASAHPGGDLVQLGADDANDGGRR